MHFVVHFSLLCSLFFCLKLILWMMLFTRILLVAQTIIGFQHKCVDIMCKCLWTMHRGIFMLEQVWASLFQWRENGTLMCLMTSHWNVCVQLCHKPLSIWCLNEYRKPINWVLFPFLCIACIHCTTLQHSSMVHGIHRGEIHNTVRWV